MYDVKKLIPAEFKFANNSYKTLIRFPYGIVGYRSLAMDNCCADFVLLPRTGNSHRITGETKTARQQFIRHAAEHCVSTSPAFHHGGINIDNPIWMLPDEQIAEAFNPVFVPGTSQGTSYLTIAVTAAGSVSYYHGSLDSSCRIRVALWPEVVSAAGGMLWSKKDKQISDKFPGLVFQTIESTHMSFNTKGTNQAIAVVARGLDALLNVQKV